MGAKQQAYKKLADTMIKNFSKRNIEAFYCDDRNQAVSLAMEMMKDGNTVGFGGSETLNEIGILDTIKNSSLTLIDRNTAKTPEEKKEMYFKNAMADYFLMSSNAVTIDGELINIDGNGNRVACLIHGPEHVILIVGMNKVVTDVESGVARVRNVASLQMPLVSEQELLVEQSDIVATAILLTVCAVRLSLQDTPDTRKNQSYLSWRRIRLLRIS